MAQVMDANMVRGGGGPPHGYQHNQLPEQYQNTGQYQYPAAYGPLHPTNTNPTLAPTINPKAKVQEDNGSDCVINIAAFCNTLIIILTLPLSIWFVFKTVKEYERAVIYRMGRARSGGARGPGTFFVIPCIDDYRQVDLRTVSFDVPPQEVLTKDSVTVSVDAVVFYRVSDPMMAINNVVDYSYTTRILAQTQLRNVLGTKQLSQLLSARDEITTEMQQALDTATDAWGVKVERVEMKDVRLPYSLQGGMAAEAAATREAKAKVITAEGENEVAKVLKQAADIMNASPATLQLRYLQTLTQIGATGGAELVFPFPLEVLLPMFRKS